MGRVYKYDLSMPVKDMYSLVEEARERFKENGLDTDGSIKTTVGYGHIGDGALWLILRFSSAQLLMYRALAGNLHINIVAKDWDEKVEKVIEPWIYEATCACSSLFSPRIQRVKGAHSYLRGAGVVWRSLPPRNPSVSLLLRTD
jgi:hypothetical protein